MVIVEARQASPHAVADIVPHLMSIHGVAAATEMVRADGSIRNSVMALSPSAVSDTAKTLLPTVSSREIAALSSSTDVMSMLNAGAPATGLSDLPNVSGMAIRKAIRRACARACQMAAVRARVA